MNMLLLEPEDRISADAVRVSGRRFDELMRIGIEPGKLCRAGMRGGLTGSAEVIRIDSDAAELRLLPGAPPPPKSGVILVAALPRPQTLDKVIHAAVTMGVEAVWFIHTRKVEKSYWQSSRLADDAIREEVILALEQCADTVMPEITFHRRFRMFFEDELDGIVPEGSVRLFGSPSSVEPVPIGLAEREKVVLAVGPEGGFNDFEEQKLRERGFSGVTLGRRILRSEFAVNALLSLLGGCRSI